MMYIHSWPSVRSNLYGITVFAEPTLGQRVFSVVAATRSGATNRAATATLVGARLKTRTSGINLPNHSGIRGSGGIDVCGFISAPYARRARAAAVLYTAVFAVRYSSNSTYESCAALVVQSGVVCSIDSPGGQYGGDNQKDGDEEKASFG